MGIKQKKYFWKENQNGWLKKTEFSKTANFQYFFAKISRICHLFINLCQGHQYGSIFMVVWQSDIKSKSGKKTQKNDFFCFHDELQTSTDSNILHTGSRITFMINNNQNTSLYQTCCQRPLAMPRAYKTHIMLGLSSNINIGM